MLRHANKPMAMPQLMSEAGGLALVMDDGIGIASVPAVATVALSALGLLLRRHRHK